MCSSYPSISLLSTVLTLLMLFFSVLMSFLQQNKDKYIKYMFDNVENKFWEGDDLYMHLKVVEYS